jgi:SAM-dependent methyltransferase
VRSRAELYDWELAHVAGRSDQDLAFYLWLVDRCGGPVLDLGCGTGRLTVPLNAVGVDVDGAMLAVARRRGARRLVRGDMRRFGFGARFGLVTIPYNSLQLLASDEDRLACLRAAASHLAPGGMLALEVTDFQAGVVVDRVGPELLASADGVTLHGALVHDRDRRMTTYHRCFEEEGRALVDHVHLRCLDRSELGRLLDGAGLRAVEVRESPPRLTCAAQLAP